MFPVSGMYLSLAHNNLTGTFPFGFWLAQPATLLLGNNRLSFDLGFEFGSLQHSSSRVKV